MKIRMPLIPLITVDPYFSVWTTEKINYDETVHWTGKSNNIKGYIIIDGENFRFLGKESNSNCEPAIDLVSIDCDTLTTTAVYSNSKIELTVKFTTPMLADDLYYSSRPVSYMKVSYKSIDSNEHTVDIKISCTDELVLNRSSEGKVWSEDVKIDRATCIRMGNGEQRVLWRSGDDIRIDWGYFYLAVEGDAVTGNESYDGMYAIFATKRIENEALFAFAYDDIYSLIYFGQPVKAYWKKDGKTISEAISEAIEEYDTLYNRCCEFSDKLQKEATEKGGEKYAELLILAYRQVMAGHKLAVDGDGNNIYISKECFSNGCAATVDVTYPSAPMYLYYNTELLKGMLRPIFRFARTKDWQFDFAPHDAGCYPIVNGQVYGLNNGVLDIKYQMPVEECGNIIILMAAIADADKSIDFLKENIDLLEKWNKYLIKYGLDPENQLCTDDFAGHLSHNCNLAIKAIMGIAAFSKIKLRLGEQEEAKKLMQISKDYAKSWCERAKDESGSYCLAFDKPGTFSLKYNAIWDKLWGTKLFPESMFQSEIERYKKEMLYYGVPLDSREKYTKSDWLIWSACLADDRNDFEMLVAPLWEAYNTMHTRVPMTDWFYCDTSEFKGFQHRTVQGGLFIKLQIE